MGGLNLGQRNVHVVDGDAVHRRDLAKQLRQLGLEAHPFASMSDFADAAGYLPAGCVLLAYRTHSDETGQAKREATDMARDIQSTVQSVLERRPEMSVIIMDTEASVRAAVQALRAGAIDFLHIPASTAELRDVLDHAFAVLPARIVRQQRVGQATAMTTQLTPREQEVLRGVVAGLTNRAIAERLKIGVRTVEMHRGNIMHKLQMDNLAALIRFALLTGILDQGLDAA